MCMRKGLIGDNSPRYITNLIKIWNDGDCAVLVDWRIPFDRAYEMLKDASVEQCYVDKNIISKWNIKDCSITFIEYDTDSEIIFELEERAYDDFRVNYSKEEAVVLFSSGTTGKSKGIILSHYAINTNADKILDYIKIEMNDCFYIVKTLCHSSTLVGELMVALKSRSRLLISPTIISPKLVLNNIEYYNVTILCINPTLSILYTSIGKIKKYDFKTLRVVYTSGAIMEKDLILQGENFFGKGKVLNVYGLTEAGPRVAAQRVEDINNKPGSVGKPIKNTEIKIITLDGQEAGNYEKGVIHVKTDTLFEGYISGINPRASLYHDWFNTGDMGYCDEHDNIFISGRYDNMIVFGSHNVYPEDLEDTIKQMGCIDDCVIVSEKDMLYGEKILCYYVAGDNYKKQLREYCLQHMATYEIPKEFIRVKQLILSHNGKKTRKYEFYKNVELLS